MDRAEALKGIKNNDETEPVVLNLPSVPETELPIDDVNTQTILPKSPGILN